MFNNETKSDINSTFLNNSFKSNMSLLSNTTIDICCKLKQSNKI